MNIKKLIIILSVFLFLLSSCSKNVDVEVEEKNITVKDENDVASTVVKDDIQALDDNADDEALSSFYDDLISDTFSIISSKEVETASGSTFEETLLEYEKGSIIAVYQTSLDDVSYICYKYDESRKGYILTDGSLYYGELYIPSDIDGCPVVEIADGAFKDNSNLSGSLYLVDSISVIGSYAFENCSGLSGALILPSCLEEIGDYAFSGVSLLGDILLPSTLSVVGKGAFASSSFDGMLFIFDGLETIEDYAFYNTSLRGDLIIPSSVKKIGQHAFESCSFDGILILNEGIETIGDYAFKDNTLLSCDIYLPSSLKTISYNAFDGCTSLGDNYLVNESGYTLINTID